MECLANFGPQQLDFRCVKPCQGKTVDFGGVFRPLGGLIGAPKLKARGDGLLGRGGGPRMRRMDCLVNFGPVQLDFNHVKLGEGLKVPQSEDTFKSRGQSLKINLRRVHQKKIYLGAAGCPFLTFCRQSLSQGKGLPFCFEII